MSWIGVVLMVIGSVWLVLILADTVYSCMFAGTCASVLTWAVIGFFSVPSVACIVGGILLRRTIRRLR